MRRWPARLGIAATAAVPLAFLAVFFALPVGGMLGRGLFTDGGMDLGGFAEVFTRARTWRVLWFTVWIAGLATIVTVALGVPVAYAVHRLALPGRRLLRTAIMLPFVMPTVVVGVMFRSLLAPGGLLGRLGLDGSWVAVLAALVFFNIAVVVRTVGGVWEGLDPRTEQSAAALGAAPWTVFRTVTLPALRPAIASAAVVVFLFCSTAFGVVLTVGGMSYATIETEIYFQTMSLLDLRAAAALGVVQLVAVAAVIWLSSVARTRAAQGRHRSGALAASVRLDRTAVPAVSVLAVVLAFLALPVGSLVVRSFQRDGEWTVENYLALGRVDGRSALTTTVWESLGLSWRIAVNAALLALVLGVAVSIVVTRRARSAGGRRVLGILDAVFMLPLGISAVTVGFGFLITLDRPPLDLRSSPVLIPIAQAMVALPLVVRTISPALAGVDPRQREAAAALGASPLRVLWTVDLPVVWRPLLAATGFALAVSLGEFGATSFLARPEASTLPVTIYTLLGRPGAANFGMALAASTVLTLLTVAVMGLVERLRVGSVGTF